MVYSPLAKLPPALIVEDKHLWDTESVSGDNTDFI